MTLIMSPADWLASANHIIHVYQQSSGYVPTKYGSVTKASACLCCSIVCLPCCVWSTIWRVLMCPFSCTFHGSHFICSDNGCTTPSDTCLVKVYDEFSSIQKLPQKMPDPHELNQEALLAFITSLSQVLKTNLYDKRHYDLCEALFANTLRSPTPVQVRLYLETLLLSLKQPNQQN